MRSNSFETDSHSSKSVWISVVVDFRQDERLKFWWDFGGNFWYGEEGVQENRGVRYGLAVEGSLDEMTGLNGEVVCYRLATGGHCGD